ncbi:MULTISPECIES: sensor histidine kinase [unclassified Massilia]|uniref:sensor histidine kinase n=1 Tax=unclassified Massilia TaxID=2609279 RepID=UPI0017812609|nr:MULTISPECIES: PAS domain-containing sensor histidine kinase [unclassified Massilia]MBD8533133.1 PAS domain S-box protein [Massilia sp. CFBP 13647]MBD8676589.1 PAS domain S-box protein [Massilia sp. CFBP 13721]
MKNPFSLRRRANLARPWRWLVPLLLVLLFLAVLFWLPWQARQMETTERQEQLIADTLWVEQTLRFELTRSEEALATLGTDLVRKPPPPAVLQARMAQMFKNGPELRRVLWLSPDGEVLARHGSDLPQDTPAPSLTDTQEMARLTRAGRYTEPYGAGAHSPALLDYYLPLYRGGAYAGSLVATYSLKVLLDETVPWWFAQDNALSLLDRNDAPVAARADGGPGRGVYTHRRALDLPGASIVLATDSVKNAPRLLPNLLVGSVIVLALGLLMSLMTLWRHISRTLAAEAALRQQMAFRTAMENSLMTGLRARDLEGRVTYVNKAFCEIVGLPPEELVGRKPPMPYWAPEVRGDYEQRFAGVLAGTVTPQFETVFQRSDGVRVPVLVFEAPLVDSRGKQTGWMSSILDITDRKKAEELNRQQQEKLETSARLATMGEISSMLAHELNQPLAAISSYTAGALNVLERADKGVPIEPTLLRRALEQARQQAQRAGQIIKSVHEFVKKSEPQRETVDIHSVVDGVRALIELQTRQSYVALQINLPAQLPPVLADRVMLEQVLLNLTRNGIEAMAGVAPERRILQITAAADAAQVSVSVIDHGHGIAPDVAERLFSPFFSTKAEGMGMGLSICRTAIEFHGGTLNHAPNPDGGTVFTFSLPRSTAAGAVELQ